MRHKTPVLAASTLFSTLVVCFSLTLVAIAGCSRGGASGPQAPAKNLATSAAVGAWRWKQGGLSFTLRKDGTGQYLLLHRPHPLTWSERNGMVTVDVRFTDGTASQYTGALSADKTSLTITQSQSRMFWFFKDTLKQNQVFRRQPAPSAP